MSCIVRLFFVLTRVGVNWVSAVGHDMGGEKKVFHCSEEAGYTLSWREIKDVVGEDNRLLAGLLSPVRGRYIRSDSALLLTVFWDRTEKKIHGYYYLPMREDEDALPQSYHHFAFAMNRNDGESVTGYL